MRSRELYEFVRRWVVIGDGARDGEHGIGIAECILIVYGEHWPQHEVHLCGPGSV